MMDLVERARNRNTPYGWLELVDKMADEIERLKKEIKQLRTEIERWQAISEQSAADYRVLGEKYRTQSAGVEQLRTSNAELVEVLKGLLQFNEDLCADIGVSKHYPSAERARTAIAQAEGRP